jgi:hypothetical protein
VPLYGLRDKPKIILYPLGSPNRTLTSSDGKPDLMSNLAVANPAGSLA